jgi:Holliday junction DNA helicase RuvA
MIGRLVGTLEEIEPGRVVVDVAGVGYLVQTTLRASRAARDGRASLWIHTHVRDDAIVLYGFTERVELETFELLIGVAGVGPRTALAVLSAFTPSELADAVASGDTGGLQRTPGVGRKTAERIQLELRGRIGASAEPAAGGREDAVSALVNLGYSQRDARRAVDEILRGSDERELGDVLRLALQRLTH